MEYASKNIDHLGIVVGVCKEIGLVREIDNLVGINTKQIVTAGEAVTAIVINALGFVNRPLYLFPEFMRNKPTDLFFHDGLKPEDFNDDTMGRSLVRGYQEPSAFRSYKIIGIPGYSAACTFNSPTALWVQCDSGPQQ